MADISKNGVSYNLATAPYTSYRRGYVFHFSTLPHLQKFEAQAQGREEWLCDSLSRRFHFWVDACVLALFQLYVQIEGRGFYVVREDDGTVFNSVADFSLKVV